MSHSKRIATGDGKTSKWISKPSPGSHPEKNSMTLVTLLRDTLKYANNSREAKKIINDGLVLVDSTIEKNHKSGVGLMDVIELPKIKKAYRIIPTKKGMQLAEIGEKDAKIKLCKVVGKQNIKNGAIQLSFHDGTTIMDEKKQFKVNDTAVITLPDRKIKKKIEFKEGAWALIISGRHSGGQGKIAKILPAIASRKSLTTVGELDTLTSYVFAVGDNKAEVKLD